MTPPEPTSSARELVMALRPIDDYVWNGWKFVLSPKKAKKSKRRKP